jgi:hypothetical protein
MLIARLQASTTGVYLQYATSTFGYHSLLGTVYVILARAVPFVDPLQEHHQHAGVSSHETRIRKGLRHDQSTYCFGIRLVLLHYRLHRGRGFPIGKRPCRRRSLVYSR